MHSLAEHLRRKETATIPEIAFSEWVPWEYKECPEGRHPGVYLLSRFDITAPKQVDPTDRAILYIGETVDQTLSKRFYQFHRSAFLRKNSHSGGWTFSDKFCGGIPSDPPSWLHVSMFAVTLKEPYLSAFIRLVERKVLWDFVRRWDAYPECSCK